MGNAASIGGYAYPIRFESGLYRYANEDRHLHSVRLGSPGMQFSGHFCPYQNLAQNLGGDSIDILDGLNPSLNHFSIQCLPNASLTSSLTQFLTQAQDVLNSVLR